MVTVHLMLFKVYGAPLSPSTRRVALVAKDRNIPYEIVPVNLRAAEHKQPAHLQHHRCGACYALFLLSIE
jgi:glutathione S-transferase